MSRAAAALVRSNTDNWLSCARETGELVDEFLAGFYSASSSALLRQSCSHALSSDILTFFWTGESWNIQYCKDIPSITCGPFTRLVFNSNGPMAAKSRLARRFTRIFLMSRCPTRSLTCQNLDFMGVWRSPSSFTCCLCW